MTTGNVSYVPPSISWPNMYIVGVSPVGVSYSKTWSGTDRPKLPKTYRTVVETRPGYWCFGPKGQKYWVPPKARKFKKRVWVVRDNRRDEEHAYSMLLKRTSHFFINRRNGAAVPWKVACNHSSQGTSYEVTSFNGDPWTSNDEIALIGKLREKIAGSEWNLGVALAEAPQALRMIAQTAQRIDRAYRSVGKALKSVRYGNLKAFEKHMSEARWMLALGAKGPKSKLSPSGRPLKPTAKEKLTEARLRGANNWLELQYGWLPLVNDVYDGADFLAHQLNEPLAKEYKARRSRAFWPTGITTTGATAWKGPETRDGRSAMQIKAILREKDAIALSGLLDPLSIVWEKLPYSFVIDWFIPIGNWLQARGLAQSVSGTFVTSRFQKVICRGVHQLNPDGTAYPKYTGGRENFSIRIALTRTISTTLSVPKPAIKPLMSVPSWRKAANAVSLLIQKLPRS